MSDTPPPTPPSSTPPNRKGQKFCTMGKHWVDLEEFNANSKSKDGKQAYCRECGKEYQKKNYEKTKERRSRYHKAKRRKERRKQVMEDWHKENPEANRVHRARHRARQLGIEGTYTQEEWTELQEYYGHQCLGCLRDFVGELEADHVISLKNGGSNTIDNIQPLCISCNRKKGIRNHDFRPRWESLRAGLPQLEEHAMLIVEELVYNRYVGDSHRWVSEVHGADFSLRLPSAVAPENLGRIRITIETIEEEEEEEVIDDLSASPSAEEDPAGTNLQADPEG